MHCLTVENPADLGSRGVLASQLKGDELWWRGPQWLTGQIEDWPVTPKDLPAPESLLEAKKSTSALLVTMRKETGVAALVSLNDYSELQRLVRVVAWVIRFVNNLKVGLGRRENTKQSGKLEARE